jgi:hypothetical protein
MNRDHKDINIDAALNQMLGSYNSGDGGDYADFLSRLAEHDKMFIPIDTVLEEKLEFQHEEYPSSWKNIVAIIWFRRVRNASVIFLLLLAVGYGLNVLIRKEATGKNPSFTQEEPKDSEIPGTGTGSLSVPENISGTALPVADRNEEADKRDANITAKITQAIENTKTGDTGFTALDNGSGETEQIPGNENENTFQIAGLKKFQGIGEPEAIVPASPFSFNKPDVRKLRYINRLPNSGIILGLNLINSFQHSHSSINRDEPHNINRNYEALSANGRSRTHVINYGISIEKTLFRGFGLSLGINKLTIVQKQHTDYVLKEVPVIDIDGNIAGYFGIADEKINERIENRVDYISVPFNLVYGLSLGNKNSLKFMFGTNMLGLADKDIKKFDYKTLDLKTYDNSRSSFSLGNNLQYGLSYSRNLRNNMMLSFGIERQVLKVKELSDNLEKTASAITNMTISIQYRL